MADVEQYSLTHRELIELMIRHLNIHEGEWALSVGLGVGMGTYGPNTEQQNPGVAVTVNKIGIQRIVAGEQKGPGSIVVDAAKVNPRPGLQAKKKRPL